MHVYIQNLFKFQLKNYKNKSKYYCTKWLLCNIITSPPIEIFKLEMKDSTLFIIYSISS